MIISYTGRVGEYIPPAALLGRKERKKKAPKAAAEYFDESMTAVRTKVRETDPKLNTFSRGLRGRHAQQ